VAYKTIGIIGGMGALATVDIFQNIVTKTYARNDQEHIPILIDNNTRIPCRAKYLLGKGESPIKEIMASANKLKEMGADFLLLPCNTAHYFYESVSLNIDTPVLNMVEETAKVAAELGIKKVGMLGTRGFITHVNYQQHYKKHKVEVTQPTDREQKELDNIIFNGVKKHNFNVDTSLLLSTLDRLYDEGAEAFVLACTELPIMFSTLDCKHKIINPTDIVAKKAILLAGGKLREE